MSEQCGLRAMRVETRNSLVELYLCVVLLLLALASGQLIGECQHSDDV